MPTEKRKPHAPTPEQQLKRLKDRFAVVLAYVWAKNESIEPFEDDDFWWSSGVAEIRTMPEYQQMLHAIDRMVR